MKQLPVTEKVCRKCGQLKPISEFRPRTSGFILNQCKDCEKELSKERRNKVVIPSVINITTKSGKVIVASIEVIPGGRITTSDKTEKVLYFDKNVNRDTARLAFSTYANIDRTGITYTAVPELV